MTRPEEERVFKAMGWKRAGKDERCWHHKPCPDCWIDPKGAFEFLPDTPTTDAMLDFAAARGLLVMLFWLRGTKSWCATVAGYEAINPLKEAALAAAIIAWSEGQK